MKRTYGWIKDREDSRDFPYKSRMVRDKKLPSSTDLREFCSPVEDQGNLGSCTACALAGAVEFLDLREGHPLMQASKLFIYYNERDLEGTVFEDSGAEIRDGIKTLAKFGVCDEKKWPYLVSRYRKRPSAECYHEALSHQILRYFRILTLRDMRECLALGFPFVFGFMVYSGMESEKVARTGIVEMPKKNEELLGGHAVMAVGYADKVKKFLVRNSWGPDWGVRGYFWLPYDYVSDPDLATDFWTIRKSE